MYSSLFTDTITVRRRSSSGTDSLGNLIYGDPSTWPIIYTSIPAAVKLSGKPIVFDVTGERPTPNGVVYVDIQYTLDEEDRIIFNGIEYVVTSVAIAELLPGIPDHNEYLIALP